VFINIAAKLAGLWCTIYILKYSEYKIATFNMNDTGGQALKNFCASGFCPSIKNASFLLDHQKYFLLFLVCF